MNTSVEQIVHGLSELKQNLGVISTTNGTSPEAAVIYFVYDKDLNIYFATRKDSRKFQNLAEHPQAAFVIFNEAMLQTVQLEGTVCVVEDTHEQGQHFPQLVELATKNKTLPPIDQLGESEIMFMKFETTWARMGNFQVTRTGDVFTEANK